jgi:hypothetical protein
VFRKKRLSSFTRGQPSHKKDVGLFQGILNAFHMQFKKKVGADGKKKAS